MDLLGSILSNMDAPPTNKIDKAKQKRLKEQKEKLESLQAEEKLKRDKFRGEIEKEVNDFMKNLDKKHHEYKPMESVQRSIIHDVAEIAGITSYSFGEEEFGRCIVLFKKEFAPSEEELTIMRNSKEYDPEKVKQMLQEKKRKAASVQTKPESRSAPKRPRTNYKEKYEHLIGKESGKDSARLTVTNKTFGNVPSENKKDLRSIEETLNDIRAKKRQRMTNVDNDGESSSDVAAE
ncbi:sperm-associated antigen 7 homolog [Dendronephthya gigantea]|uniref:sperm-associated antigen 7 homolog n=1 Tax=Dendronephthya gigantea TaxID=151771 RepID=UPI00106BBE52|nr:sperm-associated antigen 7 homolog [Dendronephthya gigantea]